MMALVADRTDDCWAVGYFLVGGLGDDALNVGLRNLIYRRVSEERRASAWSYVGVLGNAMTAIGYFLGTPYGNTDPQFIIVLSGILGALVVVLGSAIYCKSFGAEGREKADHDER